MKFAHLGDCHLGGWRQPELVDLNIQSLNYAITTCIKEKVDFVLIAGDFFDSAYPGIDTIREAFRELRRLKESNIPVFLIAGSHDYSVSGKSFLDVIEQAGFATNVFQPEEKNNSIYLHPTIYKNVAIYGYPGKKSGLEVEEIAKIKLHDAPGLFKILMLHTALRDAVGTLPIPAVDQDKLPKVDYTALAHLHIKYNKAGRVYCGPLFPNNSLELEELGGGSFYIVDTKGKIDRREVRLKEVLVLIYTITNAQKATDFLLSEIQKHNLADKILILRLEGIIETGRISDIRLNDIESQAKKQGAYVFLRNTSRLYAMETHVSYDVSAENVEEDLVSKFKESKPVFGNFIKPLIASLQSDKKEDERTQIFEERMFEDFKKVVGI